MKNENTRTILERSNSNDKLERLKTPSLKLNDRSIKTLTTNFLTPTQRDSISYRFKDCKGMSCQGLRLVHYRTSNRKQLILDYWINGKARKYVMPDYNPETFNVRHIEKKIAELRNVYGNPHNLTWDKDINIGERTAKISRFKEQLSETSSKTIKEIIELFYAAGFPKIRNDGTSPSRTSISNMSRYILGIGDRKHSFKLDEDASRNGVMVLKKGYSSFTEVFKKHPTKFNPDDYSNDDIVFKPKVAIYDGPLIVYNISELTTELVNKYLATSDKPSIKIELKLALSYLWNFAKHQGFIPGTPENPFKEVRISKPRLTHMTEWNKKEFTQEQLNLIWNVCETIKPEFPGQPELFQLALVTGRRIETLLNLKWSNIAFKETTEVYVDDDGNEKIIKYHGVISVPPWSNKTDDTDKLPITNTLFQILKSLQLVRDTQEPWRRFIDWVFVSPRVADKEYLRADNRNDTAKARLKEPRHCWKKIVSLTSLTGQAMQKMFRTTYQNKVDRLKGVKSSWDAITITGQQDTRAHENNYMNKKLTPKVVHHFTQLDDDFSEAFKTRKNN